jgi:hypothetical protein
MPCSVTEQQLERILHAGQARKKPLGELVYYDTCGNREKP